MSCCGGGWWKITATVLGAIRPWICEVTVGRVCSGPERGLVLDEREILRLIR